MANTKQAAKRARQALKRQARNSQLKTATKTAIRQAVAAIKAKDLDKAKAAYVQAVRTLAKAASKGGVPARRASRKIGRLTQFAKSLLPESLGGAAVTTAAKKTKKTASASKNAE